MHPPITKSEILKKFRMQPNIVEKHATEFKILGMAEARQKAGQSKPVVHSKGQTR
jgi:hypothetical protein